ncbi:MAG: acylphosphatase [Planctomycetota bacterium]|nr:acylphosphatase [Planctomycetota bacterium]
MEVVRWTVHYSGRVQGVGFRWQTVRIVAPLPVAGYVRNLSDGRVELVVEGLPDDVEDVLDRLESRLAPYIQGSERASAVATGEFVAFEIRR